MKKQKASKNTNKKASLATRRFHERLFESDATYFLKLVVVTLLATFWIKLQTPIEWLGIPFGAFPVGMLSGFVLVRILEPHQSDRKIWYAILVVVGIVSYFLPAGVLL